MISPHFRFEGFDAASWTNLLSLFAPGVVDRIEEYPQDTTVPEVDRTDAATNERAGSVIIICNEAGRVLKTFHTSRGRIRDLVYEGPQDLPRIAETYGAFRAIALKEGVMEEVVERLSVRLSRSDDYIAQWLMLVRIFRDMMDAGQIHLYPNPMANVPVPTPAMVRRAIDLVLPDGHAIVMVLWHAENVWTGAVLRRQGGMIDFVAGPDMLARWTGPLGGDWRRDYRVISQAVSRAVAPVHLGIFAEVDTVRALLRSPDRGAWARAAMVRDLVIHPTPPYVAVALGADAVRAAAHSTSKFLGGYDAFAFLQPLATYVRGRITEVTSITQTLGFNPLSLLGQALRSRPAPSMSPFDAGSVPGEMQTTTSANDTRYDSPVADSADDADISSEHPVPDDFSRSNHDDDKTPDAS
ncbi:MAG: hypothetical protein IPK60_24390 [Sandaracinaceae bacterium]|jgi:hypothetical protein|nr:hypothetical protein [Sandaracinaceae bacterium]